jgi:hypothetical protein
VLRKALGGKYRYRRLQTSVERYTEEPDKSHPISDVADALQYVCTQTFGGHLLEHAEEEYEEYQQSDYDKGASKVTGY